MKKVFLFVVLLLILSLVLLYYIKQGEELESINRVDGGNNRIEVTFLDVGQGDATFIEWPDGTQMLIDCGKDAQSLEALGRVMDFYDKTIDYLVVTHPDLDHFGGCTDVLNRFEVGNIVTTGVVKETESWQFFWQTALGEKSEHKVITAKQDWFFGSSTISFLYPDSDVSQEGINPNNSSIVFKLSLAESDLLFTGDAEEELEKYLVDVYLEDIDVDLLKVSHHGSGGSSVQEFINTVTPDISVISSGKGNSYGHPSLRILKRLERVSSTIYRTDLQGDIRFIVYPDKILAID